MPIDPLPKLFAHLDALFGTGVSGAVEGKEISVEFSRRTGRVKNFSIGGQLAGTLRTDGGIAITVHGARLLYSSPQFRESCIVPTDEAIPFVSEGRSLFCKHVQRCGSNVNAGSDVAILDPHDDIIAVGVAILSSNSMRAYGKGVAVRIREGIKGRADQTRVGI